MVLWFFGSFFNVSSMVEGTWGAWTKDCAATVLDKSDNFVVALSIQLLRLANVWETCSAESGTIGIGTSFKDEGEAVAEIVVRTVDGGGGIAVALEEASAEWMEHQLPP